MKLATYFDYVHGCALSKVQCLSINACLMCVWKKLSKTPAVG